MRMKKTTNKRVPSAPRLRRAVEIAAQFHAKLNTLFFPIDPIAIIKMHGWVLKTYTWMAMSQGVTDPLEIRQVIRYTFDSEDAIVCEDPANGYMIIYNEKKKPHTRINFTLMHEVGHIVLGHLNDFPCGEMARVGLTDHDYKVLEAEADCFACNVLTPAVLAKQFNSKLPPDKCAKIFNISDQAWKTRITFLSDDIERATKAGIKAQKTQFKGFVTGKVCAQCGLKMMPLQKDSYCPFCGSKALLWRNDTMKYDDVYVLDEIGRPKKCPMCRNEDITDGQHCNICGIPIINRCTMDNACGKSADENAQFCIYCGAKTTYFKMGLLLPLDAKTKEAASKPSPDRIFDRAKDEVSPF